jgi:hypothetical protein
VCNSASTAASPAVTASGASTSSHRVQGATAAPNKRACPPYYRFSCGYQFARAVVKTPSAGGSGASLRSISSIIEPSDGLRCKPGPEDR